MKWMETVKLSLLAAPSEWAWVALELAPSYPDEHLRGALNDRTPEELCHNQAWVHDQASDS